MMPRIKNRITSLEVHGIPSLLRQRIGILQIYRTSPKNRIILRLSDAGRSWLGCGVRNPRGGPTGAYGITVGSSQDLTFATVCLFLATERAVRDLSGKRVKNFSMGESSPESPTETVGANPPEVAS